MENDFQSEVKLYIYFSLFYGNILNAQFDYFLTNIVNTKRFIFDWLELGEKIGHLAVEGGDQY